MNFIKSTKGKITITILIVILLLGAVYGGFSFYFNKHFFYGTVINGIDCANLTVEEVKDKLQAHILEYSLTLNERDNKTETITADQLGLTYVDDNGVEQLKEAQKPYAWITAFFKKSDYQVAANMTYNKAVVDAILDSLTCFKPENVTAPADAYIQEDPNAYTIVPEVMGNTLKREDVKNIVIDAVDTGKTALNFEELDLYEKPTVFAADEALIAQKDQLNVLTSANITYDFQDNRIYTIDRNAIKSWIIQNEDKSYTLDQTQIAAWVKQMAYETDTFGLEHEFKTSLGPTITLAAGGDYGWVIDKDKTTAALTEAIQAGTNGALEPVYLYKGLDRGINDIGDTYVEISISQQKMWCYKDGQLVAETNVITGNEAGGYSTPSGSVWAIDAKKRDADFKQYSASVTFWLPFNGGVGIHDADWKTAEQYASSSTYLTNGSHGCINTPYGAAEKIFNAMEIGYPAIVYYSTDQPVGPKPTRETSMG